MKKFLFSVICTLFTVSAAFAQQVNANTFCESENCECTCACCTKAKEAATAAAAAVANVTRATPSYDNIDNVVDAIIAQYPGQAVFVDFWATWCGPCLMAMKTIEPLKPWMAENNVARVYISLSSSNPAQWKEMVPGIGGNHYVLTKEEESAVVKRYQFNGVPSYQVYNTKGELTFQSTGYRGNEVMKAELEKAM